MQPQDEGPAASSLPSPSKLIAHSLAHIHTTPLHASGPSSTPPSPSPLSGIRVATPNCKRDRSDGAGSAIERDEWRLGDEDDEIEEYATMEPLPGPQTQSDGDAKHEETQSPKRHGAVAATARAVLTAVAVATPNDSLRFGQAGCSGSRSAQAAVDALLSPGLSTSSPHSGGVASATVHPFPLSCLPPSAALPSPAAALPGRTSTAVSMAAPPPLPPRPLWLQQKMAASVEPVSRLLGPGPLQQPGAFPVYVSAAFAPHTAAQKQEPQTANSSFCITPLDGSYFSPGSSNPLSPITSPFEMADSPTVASAPPTASNSFHMRSPLHAHEVYGMAPPSPPSVSRSVSVSSSTATDECHSMDAEEGATPTTLSAMHAPVRKASHHAPMSLCDSITECDDEAEFAWSSPAADLHSPKHQHQQASFVAVAEIINEAAGPEEEDFEFV